MGFLLLIGYASLLLIIGYCVEGKDTLRHDLGYALQFMFWGLVGTGATMFVVLTLFVMYASFQP